MRSPRPGGHLGYGFGRLYTASRPRRVTAWTVVVAVLALHGCAHPSVRHAVAAAPEPVARAHLAAIDFAPISSSRQSLIIPLPEATHWSVDDATTPWLVARDSASDSALQARSWSAPLRVRPEDCETQVRLWRPKTPPDHGAGIVDRRRLSAPPGYAGKLVVGDRRLPSGAIEGYALLFSASIGRCVALVYTTQARGAGDADAVAQRLAVMVGGSLTKVRLHRIEDRVRLR